MLNFLWGERLKAFNLLLFLLFIKYHLYMWKRHKSNHVINNIIIKVMEQTELVLIFLINVNILCLHLHIIYNHIIFCPCFLCHYWQAWSGGLYKQVIGRPIFKGVNHEDCISMAFLYSPPGIIITNHNNSSKIEKLERTISLAHQVILAILVTLVCQFLVYIYKKFWCSLNVPFLCCGTS